LYFKLYNSKYKNYSLNICIMKNYILNNIIQNINNHKFKKILLMRANKNQVGQKHKQTNGPNKKGKKLSDSYS